MAIAMGDCSCCNRDSLSDMDRNMRKLHTITFGTDSDCDIIVSDEYVSNKHCQAIVYDNGRVTIEDLGSTNGTWIREVGSSVPYGARVLTETQIGPGIIIRIGKTDIPWKSRSL